MWKWSSHEYITLWRFQLPSWSVKRMEVPKLRQNIFKYHVRSENRSSLWFVEAITAGLKKCTFWMQTSQCADQELHFGGIIRHHLDGVFRHHVLTALPDKNGFFWQIFWKKSQKSPIFDKKCSCLVMLWSGSTEIQIQPELPDLYILHKKMAIFGIFLKNFVKHPQKHLVTLSEHDA